jgi:membrane associated rhomboid family serine protease
LLPYRLMRRTEVRPYMTYAIFAVCFAVFFWELTIPRLSLVRTFSDIAITGCQVTGSFFTPKTWLDVFRSMFLHGGWLHLMGNMLYLVIFGPAMEEYFGHWRFLAFYLIAGIAAALSQVFVGATVMRACSTIPMIGASGAIAGVMGGFILMYPGVKVRVMVPLLRGMGPTFDSPAVFVLAYWIGLQLLSGFLALNPAAFSRGGVAFWAHIGGFIAGAVMVFIMTTFVPPPDQNIVES